MSSNNMKEKIKDIKQLPRSVRQMGYIDYNTRIYIEDYAYTYIQQLSQKFIDEEQVLLMIGDVYRYNNEDVIMIYGAVKCDDIHPDNRQDFFNENTIEEADKVCRNYFNEYNFLGWVYTQPGYGIEPPEWILNLHKKFFNNKNLPLLILDPIEKEECFYLFNQEKLLNQEGFFVYYEKNSEMHNYMLAHKVNKQSIEHVPVEQTIQSYRAEKLQNNYDKENKKFISMLSAISGILIILCGILGYGLIMNMDEITDLKEAFNQVTDQYNKIEENYLVLKDNEEVYITDNQTVATETSEKVSDESNDLDVTIQSPSEDKAGEGNEEINIDNENIPETLDEEKPVDEAVEDNITDVTIKESATEIPETYTVLKGDSLFDICLKFYNTKDVIEAIKELNNIKDENVIYAGQELLLP